MDYVLKSRHYQNSSEILDTVSQQPVDLDFTLADYCPDVEKILKSSLTPKIFTHSLSAGELRVDGACVVRVLYCDQNKNALRCCEQTVPFSATIPVASDVSEHVILLNARQEYLNCRALTPRRLSLHGAFSLCATIIGKNVNTVCEDAQDDKLQVLKSTAEVCELCEFTQEQFSVIEAVDLGAKSPVESIIRSDVSAVLTDVSRSADRLILKGEITLRMLYISDVKSGECDRFVYVFPFTQQINTKENDWDISDIRLDVHGYDLLLKSEMLTEAPTLKIDAKLCATVMGYKNTDITYVCDAYSTEDNVELSFDNITLCRDVHPITVNTAVKSPLSLGDKKICKILDIMTETPVVSLHLEDKTLHFKGKVNVSILGYTEDSELISVDRQIDVDSAEVIDNTYSCAKHPCAMVSAQSFRMSDNNELELRLDMRMCAVLCAEDTVRHVSSVDSLGDFVSPMGNNALVLYYASRGERVWDIAKRYATSMSSVCEENGIAEDELEDSKMLLILKS